MRVSEKKRRTEAIMDIIWLSLSGHTVREELLGRHTRRGGCVQELSQRISSWIPDRLFGQPRVPTLVV
jgi:hypothetical protein